jgi:hypothetical protein
MSRSAILTLVPPLSARQQPSAVPSAPPRASLRTRASLPPPSLSTPAERHRLKRHGEPLQFTRLFDSLKLAIHSAFQSGIAEWIEPYRPCRWCAAQARWCCEGAPELAPGRIAGRMEPLSPLSPIGDSSEIVERYLEELTARASGHAGLLPPVALRIGDKADPYPASEAAERSTRALLEVLACLADGLELSILTRSPLLLRDLDLLADLDQRHGVRVGVVIPTADPKVARRIESQLPRPASPADRLDMVHTLAAHGIETRVLCTPILPGVNNSAAALHKLFDLAHQAGASDVVPAPRHPALPPTPFESEHLLALFHRVRLEHGFPRSLPGRG